MNTTDLCDTTTTKRRRQKDYNYCSTTGEEWETTGDNYCILACLLSFPTCDCCFCNVRHRSLSMPRIVAHCCSNRADFSDKARPPAGPPARLLRAESWHNPRQRELNHDTVTARPSMRSRGFRRLPRCDLGDRKQPVVLPVRLPYHLGFYITYLFFSFLFFFFIFGFGQEGRAAGNRWVSTSFTLATSSL